jgi:hypothetical protein
MATPTLFSITAPVPRSMIPVSAIKRPANRLTSRRGGNPKQHLGAKMMRWRRFIVAGLGFSLVKEGPLFIGYLKWASTN